MILERSLSRILALTILAVLLYALFALIVAPFISEYARDRSSVITSAKQAARFERVLEDRSAIEERRAEIQKTTGENVSFFAGGSRAIVGAALQDRVRRAIASAGGVQRSAQVLAPKDVASHVQTGVRIVATIPSSQLIDLLNDLETGQPTILLGDVSLRTNTRTSRRRTDPPTNRDPELTLNFIAYGFGEGAMNEDE